MKTKIIPYNPILKEIARQLRKNMTPGEITLWKHLKGKQMCGLDFDRQRPIDEFIVDFYCKKLMLAIEIDGSSHDSQEAQQRDAERQARLESLGVRFLRFREGEVCRQVEAVLRVIEDWVLTHPRTQPTQEPNPPKGPNHPRAQPTPNPDNPPLAPPRRGT